MCQIFAGPSAKVRSTLLNTATLLEELFDSNADGWGAMYHTTSGIKAIKRLPRSVEDTRKYVEALPNDDRPVAVHWRMRTSGRIDTHNAHPHESEGGYVIHNGVLRDVDMSSNPDMCDTIHFCRQYLDGNIDAIVRSERLQRMVGEFIGNNRFVILSDAGQMCIVNKDQGYEVNGVWVANTYASPPELLIPGYRSKKTFTGYGVRWGGHLADLDDERYGGYRSGDAAWAAAYEVDDEADAMNEFELSVHQTLMDYDVSTLGAMLDDQELRGETIDYIMSNYEITPYHTKGRDSIEAEDVSDRVRTAARAWRGYDDDTLDGLARTTPHSVAEALLYYCDVVLADEPPATNGNVIELGNGFRVEMPAEVM